MFAWVWLYILQSRNSAESVNPGTLCDGGVLRAQHSPLRGRLLFIPVMSILLGISASLHTTCCAQQCGEARASRVVVSACQSQSQGSVSSHQSEKAYPDVALQNTVFRYVKGYKYLTALNTYDLGLMTPAPKTLLMRPVNEMSIKMFVLTYEMYYIW